jgi:alkylation response protein AidB-like acyl-CoA dehydrogenase
MSQNLNEEEDFLVKTVRSFIDRDVKPTVRDVEHANEYPEAWIETMKQIGIYGLAIPEEFGGTPVSMSCYVHVTEELSRGWMSLGGAMGGHDHTDHSEATRLRVEGPSALDRVQAPHWNLRRAAPVIAGHAGRRRPPHAPRRTAH